MTVDIAISPTPSNWVWAPLAELCDGVYDCPHSTPKLAGAGPYLARTQDVGTGIFRPEAAAHVSMETYRERVARAEPQWGDLLYSREGTYFGVAAEVPSDTLVCLGQRMVLIRPDAGRLDHRYLRYWLNSETMSVYVDAHKDGSVAQRINLPVIRGLPVPLPPLTEQRGIAETLAALDDKIQSNRRVIANMEELARTQFNRLFDIERNDGGVPLSTLIDVNPRRALSGGELATYVPMASLPGFSAEIYEWEKKAVGSGQRFINGDILMARITPCLENGKTAVVDMLEPGEVAWGSTEYIVLAPKGDISTAWIYCLVRDEAVRSFAIRSMTGSSGRQRFQANRFDQYKVAMPGKAELKEFDRLTGPMFARMTQLRDESRSLAALRDTLLPELLSGRIRVPEANKAVEGAAA